MMFVRVIFGGFQHKHEQLLWPGIKGERVDFHNKLNINREDWF